MLDSVVPFIGPGPRVGPEELSPSVVVRDGGSVLLRRLLVEVIGEPLLSEDLGGMVTGSSDSDMTPVEDLVVFLTSVGSLEVGGLLDPLPADPEVVTPSDASGVTLVTEAGVTLVSQPAPDTRS